MSKRAFQPQDFIRILGRFVPSFDSACDVQVTAWQQESSFNKMKDGQSALRKQQEKKDTMMYFWLLPLSAFHGFPAIPNRAAKQEVELHLLPQTDRGLFTSFAQPHIQTPMTGPA